MENNSGAGPFFEALGPEAAPGFSRGGCKAGRRQKAAPARAGCAPGAAGKEIGGRPEKEDVHFVCQVEAAIDGDVERLLSRRRDPLHPKRLCPTAMNCPAAANCPSGQWWWALARRGCSPPCCWPSATRPPSCWSGASRWRSGSGPFSGFGKNGCLTPSQMCSLARQGGHFLRRKADHRHRGQPHPQSAGGAGKGRRPRGNPL